MSKIQPYIVNSVTDAQHARMEALMDEMAAAAPGDAGIRISHVLHARVLCPHGLRSGGRSFCIESSNGSDSRRHLRRLFANGYRQSR